MIHLTYSNRTEELLAALVAAVRSERAARGPFAPLALVVPNRSIETYVKFGLAQALGIAANLEVTFLRRMLGRLAERAVAGGRLVDAGEVEGHLLALLHDEALLARPELAPVREYLLATGDGAAGTRSDAVQSTPPDGQRDARLDARLDAIDRRRFQLATRLAQLYDEYAASRPELLRAWRERTTLDQHPTLGPLERWQRALWLEVFGGAGTVPAGGRAQRWAEASGHTAVTLAELVRALERGDAGGAGAPVHVFGVSYIARGYHAALGALARHAEVHVYTLNPCREFWEDLETAGELRRRLKRQGREALFPARAEAGKPSLVLGDDPFGLQDERENLALRLWGRPGRENVRLLNQQGGGDFTGRFVANCHGDPERVPKPPRDGPRRAEPGGSPRDGGEAPGPRTLLRRLQDDILERALPDPGGAGEPDDSLRVLPCPGIRRELEVIAGEIWRLVERDSGLRLNEIAVVVPEAVKDRYLCHVPAVFAEAHQLPANIIDLPLGSGPRLADAAVALIELPLGGFTRRELLPLLTHPAVLGRFPEASAAGWLRLSEELGIVHGADRQDHAGTYIARDLLNWDQGIRRLVLGTLMDAGGAAGEAPVEMDGQLYQPLGRAGRGGDEAAGALAFGLLARSLIADARLLAGQTGPRQRPLAQWLELIRGLVRGYLVPADGDEEALLARCLSEIDALEAVPLGETPVSYRVAAELAGRALRALGGHSGQYLAHGVTVTSFVPMRAIPFRVLFVAGLGQGSFPRRGRGAELDLRAARRQPGDVSPREQDLYMFLETLLSARERLILSYVARDELTGTPLLPSSVLLELRDVLGAGYLAPAAVERLFAPRPGDDDRPPLRRHDDALRVRPGSLAHREARAKALGASLRAALPAGAALPDLPALGRALDPALLAQLGARLSVHRPPTGGAAVTGDGGASLRVPLAAIRQFLEDPLQGSARFRLRMRELDGDEEALDRADEPFATDRGGRAVLLREIVLRVIAAGEPVPTWQAALATLQALAQRQELSGAGPTGFFAAAERPALAAILRGWLGELVGHAGGQPLGGRVVRFGRAGFDPARGVPGDRHPAIALSLPAGAGGGAGQRIEIVGSTELLVGAGEPASVTFSCRGSPGDHARRHRDTLRGFVDHLALAAAGLGGGGHGSLLVWAGPGASKAERRRFRPLEPARARDYLAALVAEMLAGARDSGGAATGVHPYLLPCEAVFNARRSERPVDEEVEKLRDAYLEKPFTLYFSSVTGPVPEAVERHEPPPPAEAARMAEARFGLYFELLEEAAR
jgi:exodeoxyribonuclease V gamma subunit